MNRLLLLLALLLLSSVSSAQTRTVDPASGVVTWETRVHGVTLSLTQILPDQARAFYLNRGMTAEAIESYANACVYMTVLRNDEAPGVVHFRLADWSVVSGDRSRPPIGVDEWLARLEAYALTKAALIAFRWAQFPPEQAYQPGGDWNQGMLTTGLAANADFDLVARWDVAGEPYEGVLRHVRCAP
ncbi:MAG: hypothetical protein KZQ99_05290 [Candidatus Thiodiazotropha sp. (ex Dulcina madagascariensis)]|nr:hypothetical protein [Candidatus Thiodiazotropha sp. (ex Dulcina madagascariensis)]